MGSPQKRVKLQSQSVRFADRHMWPLEKSFSAYEYAIHPSHFETQLENTPVYTGSLILAKDPQAGTNISGDVRFNFTGCGSCQARFSASVVHDDATIEKVAWPQIQGTVNARDRYKSYYVQLAPMQLLSKESFLRVTKLIPTQGATPIRLLFDMDVCQKDHLPCDRSEKREIEAFRRFNADLRSLWRTRDFSDITLKSRDGERFRAHRNILAARSGYLSDKLANDEAARFRHEMSLSDVSGTVLDTLLTWIYTAEFQLRPIKIESDDDEDDEEEEEEEELSVEQAAEQAREQVLFEILTASWTFRMDDLKQACSEQIVQILNQENALSALIASADCSCEYLQSKVIEFMVHACEALFDDEDFENLQFYSEDSNRYKVYLRALESYNQLLEMNKRR